MPCQNVSLAVSGRKTPKALPGSTFPSCVQTLGLIEEEQAQGCCSRGVDRPGNTRREQPEVRAQAVLRHPQHIHQAEFH